MILTTFMLVVMLYEFYRMVFGGKYYLQQSLGLAISLLLLLCVVNALLNGKDGGMHYFFLLLLPLILLFITQLYQKEQTPFVVIGLVCLGILYIALPVVLMYLFVFDNSGSYDGTILLSLFIMLWCNDVGAYAFGLLFGRHGKHKLFPSISPKKSWEGLIGGIVSTMLAALLIERYMFPVGTVHILAIAFIIAVFGCWGDLVESMLKRSYNVKDSGKIMPGHGGLLDRFDASLIAFPAVLVYMKLVIL